MAPLQKQKAGAATQSLSRSGVQVRPSSAEAMLPEVQQRARISPQGRLIKSVPCFPYHKASARRSYSLGSKLDDDQKERHAQHTFDLFKRGEMYGDASSYTFSQPGLSAAVSPTYLGRSSADTPVVVALPKQQVQSYLVVMR